LGRIADRSWKVAVFCRDGTFGHDVGHSQELNVSRATASTTRRPDADIFAQARRALDRRPSIPATVRVHIDDGVAWLTGMVRRTSERTEAEDVVREVPGVQSVVNKITFAEPPNKEGFEPPTD
jgi:osmotically-inducible protein OsmY